MCYVCFCSPLVSAQMYHDSSNLMIHWRNSRKKTDLHSGSLLGWLCGEGGAEEKVQEEETERHHKSSLLRLRVEFFEITFAFFEVKFELQVERVFAEICSEGDQRQRVSCLSCLNVTLTASKQYSNDDEPAPLFVVFVSTNLWNLDDNLNRVIISVCVCMFLCACVCVCVCVCRVDPHDI